MTYMDNNFKYYLTRLNGQELGYRKGVPGKAGRYFYISKKATSFFPYLSKNHHNDSVLLPIISLYKGEKIYCRYVYHNDKHCMSDGTRDEYRIYLNTGIDPNSSYFVKDDIIVFERVNLHSADTEYLLWKFSQNDEKYKELEEALYAHKVDVQGGHALCIELPFILPKVNISDVGVDFPVDTIDAVKKEQQIELMDSGNESVEDIRGASLFTSVSFREFVLYAYDQKCAITNQVISYKGLNNLEAAHIKPKSHRGSFLPCNGLALSRDMHWAFDKGMITILDSYTVYVHELVRKESYLGEYHGKEINVPKDPFFQPRFEFLEYHRLNIYGLFLRSGVIQSID